MVIAPLLIATALLTGQVDDALSKQVGRLVRQMRSDVAAERDAAQGRERSVRCDRDADAGDRCPAHHALPAVV